MISAVTFSYNEADKIEKSLSSIRNGVDEIIVYDLESTDNTSEAAKKFTTEVFRVPYLLCGDSYKMELASRAKGDWILWFYADEVFPEKTTETFRKLTSVNNFDAYGFMRREYMDDVRVGYNDAKTKEVVQFGTPKAQNYQIRLIRKCPQIYYTELVHAELHGDYKFCGMPPEYYMEHYKSSKDQEFDNIRLYIWYNLMITKYGETQVQPYKKYIDSYRVIVRDSEEKNLSGERKISLMEEFWWNWRRYCEIGRLTLEEFNEIAGIPYSEFIKSKQGDFDARIVVENSIKDKILTGRLETV